MVLDEAEPRRRARARGRCRRAPGGTPSSRRARRPSSTSAAITAAPARGRRSAGSTSMRAEADPVAVERGHAVARGRRRCAAVTSRPSPTSATSAPGSVDAARASGAPRRRPASSKTVSWSWLSSTQPWLAEQRVLVGVGQHRGDRPLAQRLVVARPPARSRRRRRTGPSPAPSWPAARSTCGSGAAASRRAARSRGPATAPGPGAAPPAALTRSRVEARGGTGLPETMSAIGMVTGSRGAVAVRLDHADAVAPRRAGAEHVGQRRSPAGAGLARHHPAYDDPLAHDMRTQGVGTGRRGNDTPGY